MIHDAEHLWIQDDGLPPLKTSFIYDFSWGGERGADPGNLGAIWRETRGFLLLAPFHEQLDRVCLELFTQFISLKGRH